MEAAEWRGVKDDGGQQEEVAEQHMASTHLDC